MNPPRCGKEKTRHILERMTLLAARRMPGQTFTAQQVGDFCGCSHAAVQQMERESLRKVRERLRKALGLSRSQIINGEFGVERVEIYRRSQNS